MKNVNRSIDVKYLRTFSHVAKHKSFTVAAESLFMTQPAVSQHIKKIENTIGAYVASTNLADPATISLAG
ncbi:hypothetical protein A165_23495 [Vibrio tasmaniensis ZS-17]|nr:hypothetical protein A165_23495 [Vibrio tasmaniensis ZS-17]